MIILSRLLLYYRKFGVFFLFIIVKNKILDFFGINRLDNLSKIQLKWTDYFSEKFLRTVQYGIFKNLKFCNESWWGKSDLISIYFGFYELQVLEKIDQYRGSKYRFFVDIGAANGYYAIGVLVSNIFSKSYAFEISEHGRRVIKKNAELNGVSSNIEIHSAGTIESILNFDVTFLKEALFLIDIEGGEFELLNEDVLFHLQNSVLIIELHEWLIDNGDSKIVDLKNMAQKYFRISELTTGPRNPHHFKELNILSDDEKWLICSEKREKNMTWLVLEPK